MPKLVGYFFGGGKISMMKPYKTYEEQLAILESRGLGVKDRERALHALQHHSYYRLSAYRFPLQVSEDQFRSGCTFEDLLGLYFFDHGLRLLVGEACKTFRFRFAHVGHTFWLGIEVDKLTKTLGSFGTLSSTRPTCSRSTGS